MFKIPGSTEIILGAGAADRWPVLISIQIEFDFTFTPPAVVPDSPRHIGSDVLAFAFYPIKNGMSRLIGQRIRSPPLGVKVGSIGLDLGQRVIDLIVEPFDFVRT